MKTIGGKAGKRQYILQSILGQGSFGRVYYSPPFAIKEITLIHKNSLQAIRNETSILRSLDHPHIVKLHDILEEQNSLFMVMEYCEMDLSQYLKKYKLDQQRATDIIKQVMGGLSYLVGKGVIHRDLKPANILVNSKNQFKLADFGLARYVQEYDSSLLQTVAGTPLYMAPQILKKVPYTTKCDIWSAGIIFYELLVGQLPWAASNQQELLYNISHKPLIIPPSLSDWAKKLLKSMIIASENERMGWDDLFDMVRWYNPRSNSRSRERPSSAKSESRNVEKSPAKVVKECLSYPSSKLRELLILDLQEFFDDEAISKIMRDGQFYPNSEDIAKIKEVMSYYNEQLRAWYLKDIPNLRVVE